MSAIGRALAAVLLGAVVSAAQTPSADEADRLYARRDDFAAARKAVEIWAPRAATEYDPAWKLARACYWLGLHGPEADRRSTLERGVAAGETAARLEASRPEGHFWYAANMGRLAESFGLSQGIKYRGRVKAELEHVIAIDRSWQGGSADGALGVWYFRVPRLFGGSRTRAEEHLRTALTYDPYNTSALSALADVLIDGGRRDEARVMLQRVLDVPDNPEWLPEINDFKKKAAERLRTLQK